MLEQPIIEELPWEDTIPRTVYQTYSHAALPESLQENVDNIRRLLPNWKYQLFTDNDIETYLAQKAPALFNLYQYIDPEYGAARADFFRYILIYLEGGLYLDIKSTITRPVPESILDRKMSLSQWERRDPESNTGQHPEIKLPGGELQQWFILAPAGHPGLRVVIMEIARNIQCYSPFRQGVGKLGVLRTTGPIAFTKALEPLLTSDAYRTVSSRRDIGLQYSIYSNNVSAIHEGVFKKHYSSSIRPVIRPTCLKSSIAQLAYVAGKRLKQRLRDLHLIK